MLRNVQERMENEKKTAKPAASADEWMQKSETVFFGVIFCRLMLVFVSFAVLENHGH